METPAPYNYQADLDRILEEIKNTIKKQFEDMFTQMDQKIKKLAQPQQAQQAQVQTQTADSTL